MSKKVVILGNSASVHTVRWVKGISERGFDVKVISLGGKEIEGIETVVLSPGRRRSLGYLKYLSEVKRLTKSFTPDLLHSHYATGFGLWGFYSGFHPYLISVWGADIIDFPDTVIKRFLLRKIILSADHLTSTSRFLRQKTVELCSETESKIDVIPFGVNIPEQFASRLPENRVRLAYIKAHGKKYGPDVLLQAVQLVLERNYDVHLSMAGEGELTEWLKSRTEALGLEESVTFTGFIDNRRISEFLSGHDIMVMPSVMDSESFGVAALEAAAVGLPVIASDIGGVPEVLMNEATGILVPPGDPSLLAEAIIRLIEDVELRKRMGEAGRKFVAENYQWDSCLDAMIQLYERLIAGKDAG